MSGGFGNLQYYPNIEGTYKTTQKVDVDSALVAYVMRGRQAEVASWQSVASSYEGKKKAYNQAIDDETARRADLFKALFEAPIEIPERPCPPTAMGSFAAWGSLAVHFPPSTEAKTQEKSGNNLFIDTYKSSSKGWIVASTDISKTDADAVINKDAAKVWGILGQSELNTPEKSKPFRYAENKESASKAHMMVSIYPRLD